MMDEMENIERNMYAEILKAKKLSDEGKRPLEDHEKVIYEKLHAKFGE